MPNDDYGYDSRRDLTGRSRVAGTPEDRVSAPSRIEGRGVTPQIERGVLREIRDRQSPAVTRVKIGKLGDGIQDYGIQVFDASGNLVLGASGLGIDVVGTDQLVDGAVTTPKLPDGAVIAQKLSESSKGFGSDLTFSASDSDTVAWTSGTIELADGTSYSINAGNTGNMTALTYIYLDPAASATALQTTTAIGTATGEEKVLLAVAKPATSGSQDAFFVPAVGVLGLNQEQLSANAVATNQLQANSVTATKISVAQLDAISVDAGTITAGLLQNASGSRYIDLNASGNDPFIEHPALTLQADGDAEFGGTVSASRFTAANAGFDGYVQVIPPSPATGEYGIGLRHFGGAEPEIQLLKFDGTSWGKVGLFKIEGSTGDLQITSSDSGVTRLTDTNIIVAAGGSSVDSFSERLRVAGLSGNGAAMFKGHVRLALGGSTPDDFLLEDDATALAVRTLSNPLAGEAIFKVQSSGESERLRVEHSGVVKTSNSHFESAAGKLQAIVHHGTGSAASVGVEGTLHTEDA